MSNLTDKLNSLDTVDLLTVARMCRMPDSKYHFNKSTPKDALISMVEEYSLENREASDAVHRALHIVNTDYVPSDDVPAVPAVPAGTDPLSMAINSMVTTQLEGVKADMVALVKNIKPVEKVITVVKGERRELPAGKFLHPKFEEVIQLLQHGMHATGIYADGSPDDRVFYVLGAPLNRSSRVPFTCTTGGSIVESTLYTGGAS